MIENGIPVFGGKALTRREILIAREAARLALRYFGVFERTSQGEVQLCRFAANEWPLPKVTVPRVVQDNASDVTQWCVKHWEGHGDVRIVHWRYKGSDKWHEVIGSSGDSGYVITPERIAIWADLFANPTEEVEDDGSTHSEQPSGDTK
jgi:hypothetical protein